MTDPDKHGSITLRTNITSSYLPLFIVPLKVIVYVPAVAASFVKTL
jgi:hypothetical protein